MNIVDPGEHLTGMDEGARIAVAQRVGACLAVDDIATADRKAAEILAQNLAMDAIEQVRKRLLDSGASEDELKAIDKEIRQIVSDAADFAESAPEPELHELYTDVLVEQY